MALTALAIGVVLRVAGPLLWNTDYLFNRLPHFMFWSFALGWTIALFGRARPLLITALILLLAPTLTVGLGPKLWVTLGALSLLWLPPLRLPASLAWVLAWVSAASLYIYIAQPFFFTFAQRLTPGFYPFSGWLVAMLGGGLLRVGADYGWSFLRSRIRSPRRSALAPG